MYFSPSLSIRSSVVFMLVMPSLVFDEMGISRNFRPSLVIACIMLRLKRRFVPSSFCSIASSSALGFADQEDIVCVSFLGIRSVFERTCSCGWKKRL